MMTGEDPRQALDRAHEFAQRWRRRVWAFNGIVIISIGLAGLCYLWELDAFSSVIGEPILDAQGKPTGQYFVEDGFGGQVCPCCCGPLFALLAFNGFYRLGPGIRDLVGRVMPQHWGRRWPLLPWWIFTVGCAAVPWVIPIWLAIMVKLAPGSFR